MKNNVLLFLCMIFLFIFSCEDTNRVNKVNKDKDIFDKIRNTIYAGIDSLEQVPSIGHFPVYVVRHQKKFKNNYIALINQKYFNIDSTSGYEIYRGKLVIYYSKNFFGKYFQSKNMDSIKDKYNHLVYNEKTIGVYTPSSVIFQIIPKDSIVKLSIFTPNYGKLFDYGDRYPTSNHDKNK